MNDAAPARHVCSRCSGSGAIHPGRSYGLGLASEPGPAEPCPDCGGTGLALCDVCLAHRATKTQVDHVRGATIPTAVCAVCDVATDADVAQFAREQRAARNARTVVAAILAGAAS